jgi:thiamine-phosphate pyrophosphorylase
MKRRQTLPSQWLIVDSRLSEPAIRSLAAGSGLLVLGELSRRDNRRLRALARQRNLAVAREGRMAARVHNIRELKRALLARAPIILLSPVYRTTSHPHWRPLPRMRAAALARLGRRKLFALGGMNARRFARVKELGFQGWAGITAFRT